MCQEVFSPPKSDPHIHPSKPLSHVAFLSVCPGEYYRGKTNTNLTKSFFPSEVHTECSAVQIWGGLLDEQLDDERLCCLNDPHSSPLLQMDHHPKHQNSRALVQSGFLLAAAPAVAVVSLECCTASESERFRVAGPRNESALKS